eukprot:1155038-Pelagomonas_calceolata.AAC.1
MHGIAANRCMGYVRTVKPQTPPGLAVVSLHAWQVKSCSVALWIDWDMNPASPSGGHTQQSSLTRPSCPFPLPLLLQLGTQKRRPSRSCLATWMCMCPSSGP